MLVREVGAGGGDHKREPPPPHTHTNVNGKPPNLHARTPCRKRDLKKLLFIRTDLSLSIQINFNLA